MNATVELLNKYKINYTVDAVGKITVGGSLDLSGLTSELQSKKNKKETME